MSKFIQKKLNKRFPVIPGKVCIYLQKLKYIILAGIILLCFNGMYGFFSLNSPWAVFSKLRAFEFKKRIYCYRNNIVYINNNRDVYSRTVFLPVPMSYGGSVCAASCYNIAISKEKRRYMFKRMQIMCKELSS